MFFGFSLIFFTTRSSFGDPPDVGVRLFPQRPSMKMLNDDSTSPVRSAPRNRAESERQFGAMQEADGQVAVFRRPQTRRASPSHPESYHANPDLVVPHNGKRAVSMHLPSSFAPPMRIL